MVMVIAGVLKLHTCIFLIYFGVLKLYFGNQIWKFMCRYFSKFSGFFLQNIPKIVFSILCIFICIKIILSQKSFRTTVLEHLHTSSQVRDFTPRINGEPWFGSDAYVVVYLNYGYSAVMESCTSYACRAGSDTKGCFI